MIVFTVKVVAVVALFGLGSAAFAGGGTDTDSDGVPDTSDNCLLVQNPSQCDSDLDGFGNHCDPDFDDNGIVNLADLARMKLAFFTGGPAPYLEEDLNCDAAVNFIDLQILINSFFLPPGPGATNAAPTDIDLDNASVAENQPAGSAVGNFSTTDANAGDTHTYTLVAGAGDTDNGLFQIVGNQLQTDAVLNFEGATQCAAGTSCSVRVQTDDGNATFQKVFGISIADANDPPEITNNGGGDNASVNAPEKQTAVITVMATDEDLPAQTLSFSLGGVDAGAFGIDAMGVLTFNVAPDFENPTDSGTDNVYDVQVTVTDNGVPNLSDVQNIAVTVTDVNEAPTVVINSPAAGSSNVNFVLVNFTGNQINGNTLQYEFSYSIDGGTTFNLATDFGGGSVFGNPTLVPMVPGMESWEWDTSADIRTDELGVIFRIGVTDTVTGQTGSSQITWDVPNQATCSIDAPASGTTLSGDTLMSFTLMQPSPNGLNLVFEYSLDGGTSFQMATDAGGGTVSGNPITGQPPGAKTWNWAATNDVTAAMTGVIFRLTISDSVFGPPGDSTCMAIYDIEVTNSPPVATDDNLLGAIGNTRFELVAGIGGTPVTPTVQLVGSVLDNDNDPDAGDALSTTAETVATLQGGSATIDANGRFVYSPPAGFPGGGVNADSFSYEVCDDGAPVMCDNGTVSIEGSGIVWYVDDSSPNNPGSGTAVDPFHNLSSASGAPTLPGETIFVYAGTQVSGITLQNNQQLIGQGVTFIFAGKTLVNAGARPVIANAGGTAITLGMGNTVRGLDVSGSNTGILGTGFGTLTADTVAISTSGGPGINLANGAGAVTFDSLSSSASSGSGIDLNSVSGTFTFGSGSISGSSGTGIDITSSSATISYGGSVGTPGGLAVNISGQSANSVSLSGNITSAGQGILLNNNGGSTVNLSGGMSLSTGAFSAFSATNGGTVIVTGSNTVTTTTGSGVIISNTTIGGSGVTFESITSTGAGANPAIILANTGAGAFEVSGVGTTAGTGGTIANKTGDAITLDNTGGRVRLLNMIIQDIGNMAGGNDTRSGHDAIHGRIVSGGLTLDNMTIRRVSDNCVNGTTFTTAPTVGTATIWDGLEIYDSLIEDCNRHHVAGVGDSQDEGAVRIQGLSGTVVVDNNMFLRAGSHFDLSSASSGTLSATFLDNTFEDAYKLLPGNSVRGETCIDLTVEGSATVDLTIGSVAQPNSFDNCAIASINVDKDTTPAGNAAVEVIVEGNQFLGTDNNINPNFGNNPQGGVALRAGPGGITTFDGIIQNNAFGIQVGPDDRIGSTDHEIINANGLPGNVGLLFESGVSQVRVNDNAFNGSVNAPWDNNARNSSGTQVSAAVLYQNNTYRGRDDYCCDSGFTFTVPGTPHRTKATDGGKIDITIINDQFVLHDQFFEAQTETLTFENRFVDGTQCVSLQNVTSPDGFEFEEDFGTIDLYQGAVNNAATGPCVAGTTGDCQNELADDGNRGGPSGYTASGAPTAGLNPPFVDVDGGSISIVGTACTLPSGGIFGP